MCVERLERDVLVERQILAGFAAAGARDVEIPTVASARAVFDSELNAEPAPVPSNVLLLRKLGVA
jgi:hypothetical protein